MEPQNVALRPQPHRRSHHWGVRSARVIVFPAAKSINHLDIATGFGINACVIILDTLHKADWYSRRA